MQSICSLLLFHRVFSSSFSVCVCNDLKMNTFEHSIFTYVIPMYRTSILCACAKYENSINPNIRILVEMILLMAVICTFGGILYVLLRFANVTLFIVIVGSKNKQTLFNWVHRNWLSFAEITELDIFPETEFRRRFFFIECSIEHIEIELSNIMLLRCTGEWRVGRKEQSNFFFVLLEIEK